MAFARHRFELNTVQADGATRRQHLEAASRQLGRPVPGLEGPECPPSMLGVWRLFIELGEGRTMHAAGPNPITWADLQAWTSLTGSDLAPIELAGIRALDRAFLDIQAEAARRRLARNKP